MIKVIFTIDYEIYGNGEGRLDELVYQPAERLVTIFKKRNVRFVTFVEVAELEMIERRGTDPTIGQVKRQIREFHREGFELGLHLHPQWYKARYEHGKWLLDYVEYNLCTLPLERIGQIIDRSIAFLQDILGEANFKPLSFRAGNWLFQPTRTLAKKLAERDVKVDSSVFKGGLQHQLKLDYRPSLKNGYYWKFSDNVNVPDPQGALLELPIYTQMVSSWRMLTRKRVRLQRKVAFSTQAAKRSSIRYLDFLRVQYPLKLDFCRMTIDELTGMMDKIIKQDKKDPKSFKPIVAIGHTKDLVDFETVGLFLSYLEEKGIAISTFKEVYEKCYNQQQIGIG